MSTPGHVFAAYLRSLFLVLSTVFCAGLFVSRAYIFYESYSAFSLKLKEENWLRLRCQDADFYSNMRQHTDLCAQVETNARSSVWLHALNMVFTSGHMCGARACMDYVHDLMLQGLLWPALVVVCLFVIMIPSIITSMARSRIMHAQDTYARNLPYRHHATRAASLFGRRQNALPAAHVAALLEYGQDEDVAAGHCCRDRWDDLQLGSDGVVYYGQSAMGNQHLRSRPNRPSDALVVQQL
jgi:hypothetical protein